MNAKQKIILAFTLMLIPLGMWIVWVEVSSQYSDFMEGVAAYKALYPEFLRGRYDTVYIGLIISFVSFLLAISSHAGSKTYAAIKLITLIISGSTLALNLFGLM